MLQPDKQHRHWVFIIAAVLLTLSANIFSASGVFQPSVHAEERLLSAVYVYDGNKAKYRDDDAAKLDQMFYSFALFRQGRVSTDHWKNIKQFQTYIKKHPAIMPILSVGGWGADGFSQAASTPERRAVFVSDTLALMQKHGFLGVDIDWEYPGSSDARIHSSPDDRENFTLLLQDMRNGLDSLTAGDGITRMLCIAISGSPYLIPNLECDKIGTIVDQVNLMTYDMQQSDTASHHSALYASYPGALSADACTRAYIAAGIPSNKIMLGVVFYGHRWTTADKSPLYHPAKYKDAVPYSTIKKLIGKNPNAVKFDLVAQAPYFFDGKVFISYDDERSITQKGSYAKEQGLMGLFAWQYSSETTGTLVDAMWSR